jgi:hypothetical protein
MSHGLAIVLDVELGVLAGLALLRFLAGGWRR